MRTLTVIVALLILSCSPSPTAPDTSLPVQDATTILKVGDSTQITPDLRIAFVQVAEDSRCPASVTCVWQGNGAIRLDVTTGRGAQSVTLNTAGGDAFPREATVGGYLLTLVALEPQRQTPDPIPAQQYRASIRITRAE